MQRSYNLLAVAAKNNNIYLLALNQGRLLPTEEKIDEARHALSRFCEEIHIVPFECEIRKFGKLWLLFSNFFSFLPYDVNWTTSQKMGEKLEEIILPAA